MLGKSATTLATLALLGGCYGGLDTSAGSGGGGDNDGTATSGGTDSAGEGDEGANEGGDGERVEARLWRLSPRQFRNETVALLGPDAPEVAFPEGAAEHGITNIAANAVIDVGNVSMVDEATRQLSIWAEGEGAAISGCGASYGTAPCVDDFLADALPKAYRRPVAPEEVDVLRTMFTATEAEHGYDYAFGATIRAILLSPDFLYRTELGPPGSGGRVELTQHEIAAVMAFALTESSPDAELFTAADAGMLSNPDVREAQARRLMAVSGPLWQRVFGEWLGMTKLSGAAETSGISPTLVAQMNQEFATFLDEVVAKERGSLADVLGASYTWAGPELAALYGASHPGEGVQRIELDPAQRAGIFTQAAWLSSHATERDDYVVRRGMGIFRDAFCNAIVPPDIDVEEENDKLVEPDATVKEVVDARAAAPNCGGCHQIPDPIGLAFETFDNSGRWRTEYLNGNPVESVVDVPTIGPVSGGADLSRKLAESDSFQLCFVRRFAHTFAGKDLGDADDIEWTNAAYETLVATDTNLEEMVVTFVRHDGLVERDKGGQ